MMKKETTKTPPPKPKFDQKGWDSTFGSVFNKMDTKLEAAMHILKNKI